MTTTRLPRNRENPFVVLPLGIARSDELSGTEFKVLTILLSLPEGWQPTAKHLATQMREGTYAISKALKKLKDKGYLVCHSVRDSFGKFLRTDWDIHESPQKPEGENLDINGNIIEFDRPTKSKNLRQAAKEKRGKAKSETVAISAFNPHLDFPNLDNCEGSNIDTSNIDQDLERDSAAQNTLEKEILTAEERASESFADRQVFVEALGEERDGRSDQCSATAESAGSELNEFKAQLEKLGKNLGRRSPLGWAYTIVQNVRDGKSSTYWEEFKAGVPLGTSEQREWEIEPGVPCSIAIQCLHQDYLSRPGTTPQEAALKAARTIARPKEMAAVWESIKSQVMFRRSEWERQSELGVQSPVLDSWMMPKAAVSVEEVAIALNEIQSALPEVLKSKSELGHDQELKALQGQGKSALTQIGASQLQPTVSAALKSEIATLQGSALQIEAAVEEATIIEGAIDTEESEKAVEVVEIVDPYAPTPESLAARARARSILKNKYGRPTKAEEILAANIAEVEKMPVVESAKTVVVEYDEPIPW